MRCGLQAGLYRVRVWSLRVVPRDPKIPHPPPTPAPSPLKYRCTDKTLPGSPSTSTHLSILEYLAAAHRLNPEAEVSGPELQQELGLDPGAVRECVAALARDGLVQWDPLLSNLWLRITDKGLAAAEP